MSGVVVIPHRAGLIAVDVIILQRRSPACGRLCCTGVCQSLSEYHDVSRITSDFNCTWSVQTGCSPSWIQVEVLLVRTWYHYETAITWMIGCEHSDHIQHWRSNHTITDGILFRWQAVVPSGGGTTFVFRDRPGVDQLRLADEGLQIGQYARMVDQPVESGAQTR